MFHTQFCVQKLCPKLCSCLDMCKHTIYIYVILTSLKRYRKPSTLNGTVWMPFMKNFLQTFWKKFDRRTRQSVYHNITFNEPWKNGGSKYADTWKITVAECYPDHVKFLVPDWGDIVNSGIGLSYRPARLHRLAGPYNNPICQSRLYPPVGD